MLPRGIQTAFRDAEASGKPVQGFFIAEPIIPLAPLTPSQRESINAVVKLSRDVDWGAIRGARVQYFMRTREDKLGVTTADMEKTTERIHKAARRLREVLDDHSEPHNIAWTRIRDAAQPPFDRDSVYPVITQLVARAHLVNEAARAAHRAKPTDVTNWDRLVLTLASVYEGATGRKPTAGKPKYGGDPNPPQSEFVRFVSGVWSTLPKDVCQHPQQGTATAINAAVAKSLARLRRFGTIR
jgi:hypothetical protein